MLDTRSLAVQHLIDKFFAEYPIRDGTRSAIRDRLSFMDDLAAAPTLIIAIISMSAPGMHPAFSVASHLHWASRKTHDRASSHTAAALEPGAGAHAHASHRRPHLVTSGAGRRTAGPRKSTVAEATSGDCAAHHGSVSRNKASVFPAAPFPSSRCAARSERYRPPGCRPSACDHRR